MGNVINLSKWKLLNFGDWIGLSGIADKHPKLGNNITVSSTSEIVKVEYEEDGLRCFTKNSVYVCKYKDISFEDLHINNKSELDTDAGKLYNKYIRIVLYKIRNSENCSCKISSNLKDICISQDKKDEFDKILKLATIGEKEYEQKIKKYEEELISKAREHDNCIFIDLTSVSTGGKLAFNINGKTGIINPSVHVGMFDDTVLYTNDENEEDGIDFRYYVGFKDITPYSWTENIEHVVIHNCKGHLITFNGARSEGIHIEPDETIVINRKDIIKDGEQLY